MKLLSVGWILKYNHGVKCLLPVPLLPGKDFNSTANKDSGYFFRYFATKKLCYVVFYLSMSCLLALFFNAEIN